ncbi:MAG: hypothetical protein NTX65_06005 [Ignavibacteriales bacterium]|nr:hypothetical protein [Ignavibacteriales bacterium]
MKSIGKNPKDDYSSNRDFNEERAFTENLLNQRISFFLIFFAIVIAGAVVVKSKIFFLVILFLGVVISWVLSVTIFATAKKLESMERKHSSLIVRWLSGYFLPVFCSSLITLGFVIGAMGYFDSLLSLDLGKVTTIDQGIKKIEQTIAKHDSSAAKTNPNFKNIDSVIKEGSKKIDSDQSLLKVTEKDAKKNPPKFKANPNFRSIESIINEKKK